MPLLRPVFKRRRDGQSRTITPILLSQIEREMLDRLSTERGQTKCEVVRLLILRETAELLLKHSSAR